MTGVSWPRLVGAHARVQALVTLRSPAQVLFLLAAPTAALLAIVTAQPGLASDASQSGQAFAQMAVLGALSVCVFGMGIAAAEERASPWSTFVRTLPAAGWVVTGARLLVTVLTVVASTLPLVAAALVTTALRDFLAPGAAGAGALVAGIVVAVVGSLPFLGIALVVGFRFTPATAVAVAQLVAIPLAFAGGLIVPPALFPAWLEAVSQTTPTRAVRDVMLAVLAGHAPSWAQLTIWAGWAAVALAAAAHAYQRDDRRRFR